MNSPIDALLSRLDHPRPNGRDRWRSACPVCGGGNKSTLSIRMGDTGIVLLRCWKSGCEPSTIANALGLEITDLFPERGGPGHGAGAIRRPRLITAGQALELLYHDGTLIWVAGCNVARGVALTDADLQDVGDAVRRIAMIRDEVRE